MRALLDVNVLIALLDSQHVRHDDAQRWLVQNEAHGWASCPLTQNGCVRIMSQRAYPAGGYRVPQVMDRLEALIGLGGHAFWPDDVSLLDSKILQRNKLQGPKQLTDVYLLALAVRHSGRLVSLDAAISPSLIHKATSRHLVLI